MATDEVMKDRLGSNCENINRPHIRATPRNNNHPTVKPIALMRYLCKLVTPKGGTVLDPFTGSGTTGIAAKLEGYEFIGIEREKEYVDIANARIMACMV
jgi:site-specific DNA-methyltransferase (adenine-specific)